MAAAIAGLVPLCACAELSGVGDFRLPGCGTRSSSGFTSYTSSAVQAEQAGFVSFVKNYSNDTLQSETTFVLLRCEDGGQIQIEQDTGFMSQPTTPLLEYIDQQRGADQLDMSRSFVRDAEANGYSARVQRLFEDDGSPGACGCDRLFPQIERKWAVVGEAETERRDQIVAAVDSLVADLASTPLALSAMTNQGQAQ